MVSHNGKIKFKYITKVVMMPDSPLKILLVEDDPADAELIEELLGSFGNTQFRLKAAQRLDEGVKYLVEGDFDVILLDLSLPDSFGLDTIKSVKAQAPTVPIVVLTGLNDENMAVEAVGAGAQDYLVKRGFERELLVRAMRYAIARQRTEEAHRLQAERERLLGRMIERIRSSIDLEDILQTTVTEVRQFLQIDRVVIYRCQSSIAESLSQADGAVIVEAVGSENCCSWNQEVYATLAMPCLLLGDSEFIHAVEDVNTAQLDPEYIKILADFHVTALLTLPIFQIGDWKMEENEQEKSKVKSQKSNEKRDEEDSNSQATNYDQEILGLKPPDSSVGSIPNPKSNDIIQSKILSCEGGHRDGNQREVFMGETPKTTLACQDAHFAQNPKSKIELWGLLMAHHCSGQREWQQWEIDFLKQLADQVAIAIQQSELYRQLEIANQKLHRLATTDSLTGIANRRRFDEIIDIEWRRAAREQIPLSIIMCDIDFFKLYNDSYGHPAGDSCLQQIAQVIVSAGKRPADLVARYGGEEFAIILPNTDPAGALIVAQEIRAKVEMLNFPHMKSPVSQYVTISVGVASIEFSGTTWERYLQKSPYTLIQDADRALYHAKAKGRNRICQSFYLEQQKDLTVIASIQ
ncbi:diguanylate cyclase [Argonema galeatum]|uniref:diguanylate cyclase n=1 Tax=Argonema galeatum TaxID=2942762 RepID=UPI0020114897|nr:diguanylate cyclase [Argonema galeatum]MCL1465206.1 diguanylate cyclase [Argonema galeatum A003/A1]